MLDGDMAKLDEGAHDLDIVFTPAFDYPGNIRQGFALVKNAEHQGQAYAHRCVATPLRDFKMNPVKNEQGIVIPHDKLSPQALQGLIEEVVTRNGTDNGYIQATLEQNVAMVMAQLRRKEVVVVYDESTQTANIVPAQYLSAPVGD